MRATLVSCARRVYMPSKHMWFEVTSRTRKSTGGVKFCILNEDEFVVNIGLSERGIDDIGDISSVESLILNNDASVERGQAIMNINWDGHVITSADELYHTVWESINGVKTIESPISGVVDDLPVLKTIQDGVGIDEEDVIAKIIVNNKDLLEEALDGTLEEDEYMKFVEREKSGSFSEHIIDQSCSSFVRS